MGFFFGPDTPGHGGSPEMFAGIREHWNDIPTTRIPSVTLERRPDWDSMTDSEAEGYLRYRDALRKGKAPRRCRGFLWLYLTETNLMEEDAPADALEDIIFALRCEEDPTMYSVAPGYALIHGLSPSLVPEEYRGGYGTLADTEAMESEPPLPLSTSAILWMDTEVTGWILLDEEPLLFNAFNIAVRDIDEYLRSREGRSLTERYPAEYLETVFQPLREIAAPERPDITAKVMDLNSGELGSFLRDLLRIVVRTIVLRRRKDGPAPPRSFSRNMRGLAMNAVQRAMDGESCFPVSEEEIADPFAEGHVELMHPDSIRSIPKLDLLPEIRENWDLEDERRMPYVPSYRFKAVWCRMDDGQRAYYISWRTRVRKGEHPGTDEGYAWLYICELINSDLDVEDVMTRLRDFCSSYDLSDDRLKSLRDAPMCWAVENDLEIEPWFHDPVLDPYLVYKRLEADPIAEFDLMQLMDIAGLEIDLGEDAGLLQSAANHVLRDMDERLKEEGDGLVDLLGSSYREVYFKPFDGFFRPDRYFKVYAFRPITNKFVLAVKAAISNAMDTAGTHLPKQNGLQ